MKHIKKLMSVLLAVVMLFGLIPGTALAAGDGSLGDIPAGETSIGQVYVTIADTTPKRSDLTDMYGDPVEDPGPLGKLAEGWVDLYPSDSTMSVIARLAKNNNLTMEGADTGYISAVNGRGEFDRGYMSGWMGTLNDWFTNESFTNFTVANGKLAAGDVVAFMYTTDYGEDIGGTWNNNDKTLKALAASVGTLSPEFAADVKEYTLTVPEGTESVKITPTATNKNFQVRASVGGTEYRRTADIPVADGTVIKVTCGDPTWPTMNEGSESVPAEEYLLNVEVAAAYNTPPVRKAGVPATAEASVALGNAYTLDLTTIFEDEQGDALTYRVSVNGAAAVEAAANYSYTPDTVGSTTLAFTANDGKADSQDTYTVTLKATTAESTIQEFLDLLDKQWYKMRPVCGTDTNAVTMMQAKLAEEGYDEITAALKSSGDESYVAANGDITYFYDLSSYVGVANVDLVFTFSLDGVEKEYTQRIIVGWDTAKAAQQIETNEASQLTWDVIKGDNAAQTAVTADLVLPVFIGADAYADVISDITWESSNTEVISITTNGNAWDHEASTGTVTKPLEDTEVTLTATLTFKKDSSCKVQKTFDLTVKGYTQEELEQLKSDMLTELNEKYTDDLLKDFTSQQQLDRSNVTEDIQLPVPSRLGLVNKEITVTSSNTDVITINGYRAYVVCPFDQDAAVDLIVTLTRGSLSVEKRIPLTVKAITSEAEIDREIELMEATKAAYFEGINRGANTSKDLVTANLSAFREANFDQDGNLVWTYSYADDRGTGIKPVAIDPDDEMGTSGYNLFRSSNSAVISHENLLVNRPEDSVEVTISSVLSSTKYEKYAEQYPDNEKLQQLYRQPVSVTVTVKGTKGEAELLAEIQAAVDGVSLSEVTGLYVRETDWDENYDDVAITNVEQTWQLRMKRTDIAVTVVSSENANIAANGDVTFTDEKVAGNVTFRFTKEGVSYEKEVLVTVPVHTKTLQEQIDALAELFATDAGFDLIKGENAAKNQIKTPLKLQKAPSSYGLTGYSDVELLWTSSDTAVINPPSYGSSSVKINRPANGEEAAQVTLTLKIQKSSYGSGSGTPKTVDIQLTVPAISDAEVEEARNAVQAALANVTLAGFAESSSLGETVIDPEALTFDVQLKSITDLINAGMVEDNEINRSMQWEWSTDGTAEDGNYLKINYLKCNVMRTVGVADKQTNLKLTLTYNGYSETKSFPVTIKGMTQEDVDAAIAEMEEYETAIWEGLKGQNTDPDFVTYHLGWKRDENSVAFYRIHKEGDQFVYTLKNSSCPGNVGVEFDSWKSSQPTVIGQTTGGYGTVDILQLLKRPNFGEEPYQVTISSNMKSLRYANVLNADGSAAVPSMVAELNVTVPAFTNELASLALENVDFTYDSAQDTYAVEVPKGTTQVRVTAAAKDPAATITVAGQAVAEDGSATVALTGASTEIAVVTTVQDQAKTITLTVNIEPDPLLTGGAYTRSSDTAGTVVFQANKAGSAYVALVEKGAAQPQIETEGAGTAVVAGENIVPLEGLTAGAKDVYVVLKDANGDLSEPLKVTVYAYQDLTEKLIQEPGLSTGIFWTPMFEKGRRGDVRFAYTHVPTGTESFTFTFKAPEGVEIYDSNDERLTPDADGVYSLEIAVTSDADDDLFLPQWLMGIGGQSVTFKMKLGGQSADYRLNVLRRNLLEGLKVVDYFCIGSQYTNNGNFGLYPERSLIGGNDWNTPISIGGFGGYITYAFDEPIENDPNNPYGIDLVIYGNGGGGAGFSEPGNVLVSPDGVNWYALAGSDYFDDNTVWNYQLTYSAGDDNKIHWEDQFGNSGVMTLGQHPPKNENYPMASFDSSQPITVTGALLKSDAKDDYGTNAAAFPDWGYVDVHGAANADGKAGNPYTGVDPKTGDVFDLSWAVDADGNPVQLDSVKYVKIQTASHVDGGAIGEKSTEVNAVKVVEPGAAAVGKTAAPVSITVNGRAVNLTEDTFTYGAYFGDGEVTVDVDVPEGVNVYINNAHGAQRTYETAPEKGIIRVIVQEGEKEPLIYYLTEQTKEEALAEARTLGGAELDGYKDAGDYRPAEQQQLAQIIAQGKQAMLNATEFADIDSAVADAKAAMDALKTDVQYTQEENLAAAQTVDEKIGAIGTVTLESKAKIDIARAAYDALNGAQRKLVTKLDVLEAAEREYAALKAAADKLAADTAAAQGVDDLIDAIGTVTLDSLDKINDARTAYNALNKEAKALVNRLATLEAAEAEYAELKAAADRAAADTVQQLIETIGTVTLDSEAEIAAARAAYDALTPAQQKLVSNLGTLLAAETELAQLQAEAQNPEDPAKTGDERDAWLFAWLTLLALGAGLAVWTAKRRLGRNEP